MIQNFEVTNIKHTYKRVIILTDRLANYKVECKCTECFSTPQQLLMEAIGYANANEQNAQNGSTPPFENKLM